jgi:crotonobetainyl-CoA:carnitine CoA-transferase CaiB-like acyl-CoA transferase
MRRRRGYFVADVVTGLAMVSILATALLMAMNRQSRAEQKLADSRTAVRLAEQALAELQAGAQPPGRDADTRITIRRIDGAAEAADQVWVEVSVIYRDRPAKLVGLAPRKALGEGSVP